MSVLKRLFLNGLPVLAFLVVFPLLISLGVWQLSRAHEKEAMLAALSASTHETPFSLAQILPDPRGYQFHGIELEGDFIQGEDVLLMHQMQAQDVGYHVLTLFQPVSGGLPLWVDRGFLSVRHKNEIPPPPTQSLRIRGIIDLPEPDRFILGENILFPTKRPLEIQRLDVDELSAVTGKRALPVVILAETDLHDGLIREWEIVVMPPEKHYGYAVQWFAMAACLVVIYGVLSVNAWRKYREKK